MTHWLLHTWNVQLNYYIKYLQQDMQVFYKNMDYFYECTHRVSVHWESVAEKWDCGFQLRHRYWWLTKRSNTFIPSLCLCSFWAVALHCTELLASALGISHLWWPWPATGRDHHTLVCHFWPREPIGREHMLSPRANTGHPSWCRLSSIAMCTRLAMRTRSDDVPRKTRAAGLGQEGVRGKRRRGEEWGEYP